MPARQSTMLRIVLLLAQWLLASGMIWAACMKWFKPASELAAMWPWTGQILPVLVKLTGLVDLLGGLGLILPGLLRISPRLTVIAATGVVLLMICASVFHISRGEGNLIGVNVVFALLAAFVAWGRSTRTAA
jgi:hypothetical protein